MNRRTRSNILPLAAMLALTGCGSDSAGDGISGSVEADGSSTVFPITEAVAEEYQIETGGNVRVTVGQSGTGGGFQRFCAGEIDISNASRAISESETEACSTAGVEYLEIPIALDGLAILVNPANDFVQCLTVDELRRIWEASSTVESWSQVRPEWPNEPINLYGPGTNSGTFDYFTEEIGGEVGASRSDYAASEDDNVLVTGVAGDINALGYFGLAYYTENEGRVKLVGVDSGQGCIVPNAQTVEGGQYSPLSRPLFIYVNQASLRESAVREFVEFYLETAPVLAGEVGYVPLSADRYETARAQLEQVPDAQ